MIATSVPADNAVGNCFRCPVLGNILRAALWTAQCIAVWDENLLEVRHEVRTSGGTSILFASISLLSQLS